MSSARLASPLLLLALFACPLPPGVDAGARPDAGSVDGGASDAGRVADAGSAEDSGLVLDSGVVDSGVIDSGVVDGGPIGACTPTSGSLPTPAVTRVGRFERVSSFPMGEALLDRDLRVYLPASYDSEPSRRYPVLYLHDGQNLFDASEAAFGVEWQVDETVDALVAAGRIPEVIVVGIDNTAERIRDYTPDVDPAYPDSGAGDLYLDALVGRIKPWIESRYRVRCGREHTAVAGSSLGGLISFRAMERHGDVIGRFGCLSSSFWWNTQSALSRYQSSSPPTPLRLWLDGGSEEDALDATGLSGRIADNRAVLARALALGLVYGDSVALLEDPGAAHDEAAWAARLPSVLGYLLSDEVFTPQSATGISVVTWSKRIDSGARGAFSVELSHGGTRLSWPVATSDISLSLSPAGVVTHSSAGLLSGVGEGGALVIASVGALAGSDVVQVGAPGETTIGFEVTAPTAPGGVYVGGSAPGLGAWQPDGLLLEQGADGRWRGVAQLPRDTSYEYKYTRGTWQTVEKGAAGEEVANRTGFAAEPLVHRDEVASFAAP